jgi:hypothetical protein
MASSSQILCVVLDFLVGGLASSVAEVLTLPMDTVKVRMQLDASNRFAVLVKKMWNEEGVESFFFGMEPAIIRQLCYGSLRYGLYTPIKSLVASQFVFVSPFLQKLLAGMTAGCVSSAICNPTGEYRYFIL